MITRDEIDKLRCIRAPGESVLSLYVAVPLDPASLTEVRALARDMIREADTSGQLKPDDEQAALGLLTARARDSLGQTAAIFACGELGLLELVQLPGRIADRAIMAVRPHLRPLLAAIQRWADHQIAIIDGRDVWLLSVSGDRIDTVARGPEHDRAGFGGWYGLESGHLQRRITELTRHPYREAAAMLSGIARDAGPQPLVIGGHADGIKRLLAELPREARDSYAGWFAADPQALTPARARELAAPVLAHWTDQRERQLVKQLTGPASGVRAAVGLEACLAAVNTDAVDLLLIADAEVVPGYHCERCDALSITGNECCDWGAAARRVPDLLEEMALRTLHEGGDLVSARVLPAVAAARLR
ncbi:MAG: hypothetical protein ACLQFR_25335 [Streptosporangiaceae bacterium]